MADLTLCFKIRNQLTHTTTAPADTNYSSTRGHSQKLKTSKYNCETSQHFFPNRVVKQWNSLPADIVISTSLSRFNSAIQQLNFNIFLRFKELWTIMLIVWLTLITFIMLRLYNYGLYFLVVLFVAFLRFFSLLGHVSGLIALCHEFPQIKF